MKNVFRIFSFFKFILRSKGLHRVHSPFVFTLYQDLIRKGKHYPDFDKLANVRRALVQNNTRIQRAGVGASAKPKEETIAHIANRILSSPHWCEAFYRIAREMNPTCIVELGTGLGVSTLYWAKAAPAAQVHTFEGDAALAAVSRTLVEEQIASNVMLHEGLFAETLPRFLASNPRIDIAFIDGDHTYEATLNNFSLLLPYLHENSLVIFDDIYWSRGMERAWKEIKALHQVNQSIDFYRLGMVFFRSSQARQQFILRQSYFGI
jgi:predicted O-methyltransferase YrrM